ncbi:MAG: OB-fold nucleic acid binding domain-containing protein, partial [Candidatus Caldatribacterium sp.]|nr:OB-fold nucleic acid binding domain-containing protein [Candidatus Caldatribacterium sp.]
MEVAAHEKLEKIQELKNLGVKPYNGRFEKTHTVSAIRTGEASLVASGERVRTAGRLMAIRRHGRALFADLQDHTGRIQIYVKRDVLGDDRFAVFRAIDVGDLVGVEGEVFRTHAGELTVLVRDFVFLGKCLHPLPEKWHGLKDVEVRYRKRYLDLIMNPEVREIFLLRSRLIREIRAFLDARGFIEVETP